VNAAARAHARFLVSGRGPGILLDLAAQPACRPGTCVGGTSPFLRATRSVGPVAQSRRSGPRVAASNAPPGQIGQPTAAQNHLRAQYSACWSCARRRRAPRWLSGSAPQSRVLLRVLDPLRQIGAVAARGRDLFVELAIFLRRIGLAAVAACADLAPSRASRAACWSQSKPVALVELACRATVSGAGHVTEVTFPSLPSQRNTPQPQPRPPPAPGPTPGPHALGQHAPATSSPPEIRYRSLTNQSHAATAVWSIYATRSTVRRRQYFGNHTSTAIHRRASADYKTLPGS